MRSVFSVFLGNAKRVRDLGSLGVKSPSYCVPPSMQEPWIPSSTLKSRGMEGGGMEGEKHMVSI